MKSKDNILLTLFAILFVSVVPSANAQTAPAPIPSSDASLVKQVGRSGAFYFRKADVIKGDSFFYALGTVEDIDRENDVITLSFSFQVPGKVLSTPETLSVSVTSNSRAAKYGTNHKLRLFADGKLIVDAQTELTRPRREGASYATEIFGLNAVKFTEFEKLAYGTNIIVQVGDTKISLNAQQRKQIEDFYQLAKN